MSCVVKVVNNSRKSEIKCLLQRDLEFFFADYPLFRVPNFSSEYAELRSTSQEKMPPYAIGKLVSPPFLMKLMTPCHKTSFKIT